MIDVMYYRTENGDSPIEEYLDHLPIKMRAKAFENAERGN